MKPIATILLVLLLTACSASPRPGPAAGGAAASAPTADAPDRTPPGAPDAAPDSATTLTRYHWQLTSATDASGKRINALFARAGQPLTLDFTDRAVFVSNTCNRMRGGYAMAADRMEVGDLASTLMACGNPALLALDQAVGKYLQGPLQVAVADAAPAPVLTITTAEDDRLVFAGVPTAETRFGSKGTTEFLEVAPGTRPCNDPGRPGAQCLEVRELHYDARGLRTGQPGPWHVLGQPIEGFTHAPGTRNVLRVTRYAIANPPADSPSAAYVLDMVVESDTGKPH